MSSEGTKGIRSKKNETDERALTEENFECDGNCGAQITYMSTSNNAYKTMIKALEDVFGWVMVGLNEGYCPNCQERAVRIQKAKEEKGREG
jgi:hypothetical protein